MESMSCQTNKCCCCLKAKTGVTIWGFLDALFNISKLLFVYCLFLKKNGQLDFVAKGALIGFTIWCIVLVNCDILLVIGKDPKVISTNNSYFRDFTLFDKLQPSLLTYLSL